MNSIQLFLTPSGWFFGLDLFQSIFHNLLMYTNKFCFGYITVSCFFENFPGGWLGGWKYDFNESPDISLDLDFGHRLRFCRNLQWFFACAVCIAYKFSYGILFCCTCYMNQWTLILSYVILFCINVFPTKLKFITWTSW